MLSRVYMALLGSESHEALKSLQIFYFFKSDRLSNWNHSQLVDNNRQIKKHFIDTSCSIIFIYTDI